MAKQASSEERVAQLLRDSDVCSVAVRVAEQLQAVAKGKERSPDGNETAVTTSTGDLPSDLSPLCVIAFEVLVNCFTAIGPSAQRLPRNEWAVCLAAHCAAGSSLAVALDSACGRKSTSVIRDAISSRSGASRRVLAALSLATRSRIEMASAVQPSLQQIAHGCIDGHTSTSALWAEWAIFGAESPALTLVERALGSHVLLRRPIRRLFDVVLASVRGSADGVPHTDASNRAEAPNAHRSEDPYRSWAAWAGAQGRALAAAPLERFVLSDLSPLVVVGEGLERPLPPPDAAAAAAAYEAPPRLTATGRALCDAMAVAAALPPALGLDAALATARAGARWLRGVVLTPGPHPLSWDGGRPGSSWARHISRGASVVSDVLELRGPLLALLTRHQSTAAAAADPLSASLPLLLPPLQRLAASLHSDALAALAIVSLWVRDAAAAHVAPAMGTPMLRPGTGGPAGGGSRPNSSGGGGGGGGGGGAVERVSTSRWGWGWCCGPSARSATAVAAAPAGAATGTPARPPLRSSEQTPHRGSRVAPEPTGQRSGGAPGRHPYATGSLIHDTSPSAPPPPQHAPGAQTPLTQWVHLAALLLHVLQSQGGGGPGTPPLPLLLPPERALAPLLALRPTRQVLGLAGDLLLPLLRGVGGLRADVSGLLTCIAVDCVLAAILGGLRGGSIGLAYPGLPAPPLDGEAPRGTTGWEAAPLELFTASPPPGRAAVAAVGLTPAGAVQWAVDLLYVRLWLALGAPARTPAAPAAAAAAAAAAGTGADVFFTPVPQTRAAAAASAVATPAPPATVATPAPPPGTIAKATPARTPVRSHAAVAPPPALLTAPRTAPPATAAAKAHPPARERDEVPQGFSELASLGALLQLGGPPVACPHRQRALLALAARALERHSSTCAGRGVARVLAPPLAAAAACTALSAASQAACDLALLRLLLRVAELPEPPPGPPPRLLPRLDAPALTARLQAAWAVLETCARSGDPHPQGLWGPAWSGARELLLESQARQGGGGGRGSLLTQAPSRAAAGVLRDGAVGEGKGDAAPAAPPAACLDLGPPGHWSEALGSEGVVYGATAVGRVLASLQGCH